jgi:hypothetical protein
VVDLPRSPPRRIVAAMPALPLDGRRSLLERIADRWRDARAAALLHSLPHGEVGLDMPAPATLAPRTHAMLQGIAHPAVVEVGVPATIVLLGIAAWQRGWSGYGPRFADAPLFFLLFHLLTVHVAAKVGQATFRRRYLRLAREEYSRRLWHAREAGDA